LVNYFSFSGGTNRPVRPRQQRGFDARSPTEMCETYFKDFSFWAIAGRGVKTIKPDVVRVRDALREN